MQKDKKYTGSSALRRHAARELEDMPALSEALSKMSPQDSAKLIHELRVHQIELEMQNDELRRIQGELEKARDRYSDLYDFAPVGYFSVNEKGVVATANLTAASLLGVPRAALVGSPFSHFVLCEDQETYYLHRRRLLETRDYQSCELRLVKADGNLFNANLECMLIEDSDSEQIGIAVSDITKRKRTEEALRESEIRLKRTQEIAHLGSWELDLTQNRLTWSDEVYRIFGLQPQEFAASYEAFLERVHPEDRAAVDRVYSASVREGRDAYEIEHRVVRKSTGEIRWVREKCQHVRNPAGRITRSLGMVLDITDRKQTEQALQKAHDGLEEKVKERTYELESTVRALELEIEERKTAESRLHQLSRVFMEAADPIVIENLSGTILEMNREAEKSYRWKRQELIGKSIRSIIPSEHHQRAKQLRQRCISGEEVRNWEAMRQDQFGQKFFVLLTAFPLTDEFGKPEAVATIAKDITFRKQMEAELEESHQRLRDLSRESIEALESDRRNVARELHDSIGGSLAAIKLVLEGIVGEMAKRPDHAGRSVEKSISHLIDTIRETKRISANLRPLTLDDLGLLPTIDWHTRQFIEQHSGIRLIKQIDIREEEIPDSSKIVIYRVLQEALNNCAKHSKADTVHIGLKRHGNEIEFELKDNGCGFDVEEVFNRNDPLVGNGLKNMKERAEICGGLFLLPHQTF
jgi:PAS domain S-box-containing protein